MRADVDVLAPCGLGEVIRPEDVPELRCRVIAGAANNPLADTASAAELAAAGILYVPDFLANCGGIIRVAGEILGFDEAEVERRTAAAIVRTADVLEEARASGRLPNEIAVERAEARIRAAVRPATRTSRPSERKNRSDWSVLPCHGTEKTQFVVPAR